MTRLRRIELTCRNLPSAFEGLKLFFFSDLHLGKSDRQAVALAGLINESCPDVVLFGGDLVDWRQDWSKALAWLQNVGHRHPLCLAVPGNWDLKDESSCTLWAERITSTGFLPLKNKRRELQRGRDALVFVGLDDVRYGQPDVARAFADIAPAAFRLLLCHSPDGLTLLGDTPFDLMLCGHTHGGQIRVPFYGALYTSTHLGKQYQSGLYRLDDQRQLYLSRGLGGGFIKPRFCCPPEAAEITLRAAAG